MKSNLVSKIVFTVVAMVVFVLPSLADSTMGSGLHRDRVAGHGTDRYTITFVAGETASVGISGDHTTELDLYVYDDQGNLVARDDNGYGDERLVKMIVYRTSVFTIRVVNRGSVYNDYAIGHN